MYKSEFVEMLWTYFCFLLKLLCPEWWTCFFCKRALQLCTWPVNLAKPRALLLWRHLRDGHPVPQHLPSPRKAFSLGIFPGVVCSSSGFQMQACRGEPLCLHRGVSVFMFRMLGSRTRAAGCFHTQMSGARIGVCWTCTFRFVHCNPWCLEWPHYSK